MIILEPRSAVFGAIQFALMNLRVVGTKGNEEGTRVCREVTLKGLNFQLAAKATILLALSVCIARPARAADNEVAHARELAYSGKAHRDEALALLKQHLDQEADDSDARVLYGIVLSWQGRYDEARTQLNMVLATRPTHGD